MTSSAIIQRNRSRIMTAAMTRLHRKTGGNLLVIKLPDKEINTVEITEGFMKKLLLRFEWLVSCEYGKKEGNSVINTAYENAIAINRDTEYLTESGKLLIDGLLNEVVEYVKNKYVSGSGKQ